MRTINILHIRPILPRLEDRRLFQFLSEAYEILQQRFHSVSKNIQYMERPKMRLVPNLLHLIPDVGHRDLSCCLREHEVRPVHLQVRLRELRLCWEYVRRIDVKLLNKLEHIHVLQQMHFEIDENSHPFVEKQKLSQTQNINLRKCLHTLQLTIPAVSTISVAKCTFRNLIILWWVFSIVGSYASLNVPFTKAFVSEDFPTAAKPSNANFRLTNWGSCLGGIIEYHPFAKALQKLLKIRLTDVFVPEITKSTQIWQPNLLGLLWTSALPITCLYRFLWPFLERRTPDWTNRAAIYEVQRTLSSLKLCDTSSQ